MISSFLSRIIILVFGTLFPAYYSYKAVRTKNVKEYVKWMMYWIVFAFFTCAETFTDVFLSFWFPFYYEIKILVVLWLLSPATKGSSILYRQFVHPWLTSREGEIDACIARAKEQGYSAVVQLGTRGVHYATNVIMQTAIKGGGSVVGHLRRSYSTSEIGIDESDYNRNTRGAISYKRGSGARTGSQDTYQEDPMAMGVSDDDSMDLTVSPSFAETRRRAQSESNLKKLKGGKTGPAISMDNSEGGLLDIPVEPIIRRRSPRTHNLGRFSESTSQINNTSTRRIRLPEEPSYATLPRPMSRRSVKKRTQ